MLEDLDDLERGKREESDNWRAQKREWHLKRLLEYKIPDSWIKLKKREEFIKFLPDPYYVRNDLEKEAVISGWLMDYFNAKRDEKLLTLFSTEEPGNELKQLTKKREQWKTERKPLIEKQIKEKVEELKKETEKFEMAVSSVIDKWIELHPDDKGLILYPL